MKKNITSLFVVAVVICALMAISFATPAAADDARPTVINCTCKAWNTYIEDCANWVDRVMIREGAHPTQFYHEASKVVAKKRKRSIYKWIN